MKVICDNSSAACEHYEIWPVHSESAQISREHYEKDVSRHLDDDEAIFSVDIQRVIMLPSLPGMKTCVFTHK